MKTKSLLITILIIYLLHSIPAIGQNSLENQMKYWYYRDRLRYFIIPSESPLNDRGSYLVITNRNKNYPGNPELLPNACFGQQMAGYGKYIGVLATEYYLLRISGQTLEAEKTNEELLKALRAYERVDKCEELLDPPLNNEFDGFFIRHDVPNYHPNSNPFIVNSDVNTNMGFLHEDDQLINPITGELRSVEYVDAGMSPFLEDMSKDEAIFLLVGLALAHKFGSDEARSLSSDYAHKVLDRMYGYVYSWLHWHNWIIFDAYGSYVVPGDNCQFYSAGLARVASSFFGFDGFLPYPGLENAWAIHIFNGLNGSAGHMAAAIAAIGEGWGPLNNIYGTQAGIYNNTDQDNWQYYYLWLYKALWNNDHNYIGVDQVVDRLNEAPCEGPWFISTDEHASGGWASIDRWRKPKDEQNGDSDGCYVGIFPGFDYMLLLNLFYICNGDGLYNYRNHINGIFNGTWPQGANGSSSYPLIRETFRTIESTERIQNGTPPGYVAYEAGESILLKDGFKVENGASFYAKIKPLDYCSNPTDEFLPEETRNKQYSNQNNSGSRTYWQDIDSYQKEGILVEQLPNERDIKVFPNPAKEAVNITNVSSFDIYEIFDASGKSICKGNIIDEKLVIGVLNYKSGLYLILLRSDDQMIVKRFSVNH